MFQDITDSLASTLADLSEVNSLTGLYTPWLQKYKVAVQKVDVEDSLHCEYIEVHNLTEAVWTGKHLTEPAEVG